MFGLEVSLELSLNCSSSNNKPDLSPVYPVSPELREFVLKSSLTSGDNLSKTGDKPSKYGDRFSLSGVILCSPELPEIFFSIFITDLFVESLPIEIFIPSTFCRFDLRILILLISQLRLFGQSL